MTERTPFHDLVPSTPLARAFAAAEWLHSSQTLKQDDAAKAAGVKPVPYLTHLVEVMSLLIRAGASTEQLIAGLLHDALEDQPCTPAGTSTAQFLRDEFGETVYELVEHCSDTVAECVDGAKVKQPKPDWATRKKEHIRKIDAQAQVDAGFLLITLCDKLSNAQSIVHDVLHECDQVWDRFNNEKDPRRTAWYYSMMLQLIQKHSANLTEKSPALIARLERNVAQLSAFAEESAAARGLTGELVDLQVTLQAVLTEKS